jgi:1-acyl-sn-glycerol-3-phosphate acyltransferase
MTGTSTPLEDSTQNRATESIKGGPLGFLRAVVLWLAVILTTIVFSTLVLALFPVVYPFDKRRHALHVVATLWGRCIVLLNPWWRFTIEGLENLPRRDEAVVYVANHNSQTDILAIFLLGVRFRWLSKDTVFKVPMLGWAMSAVGYVSVKRGDKSSHFRCMDEGKEHLRHNTSMVFFPEGTRSRDGAMQPFKSGAFRLAKEVGAPVVPVSLVGTDTLLSKENGFPSVTTVRIVVHPAIPSLNKSIETLMEDSQAAVASALPEAQRLARRRQ